MHTPGPPVVIGEVSVVEWTMAAVITALLQCAAV